MVVVEPPVYQGRGLDAINGYYLLEEDPGEDEITFLRAVAEQTAVAMCDGPELKTRPS